MAAPKGNDFWKKRTKHGRDKIFKTPDALWQAACEYFTACSDNPIYAEEPIKSGDLAGTTMQVAKVRPFTLHGLCLFLGVNTTYFRTFKSQQAGKTDEVTEGFNAVIKAIEDTIYNQKFEHAATGLLNANLISRELGLADTQNVNMNVEALPMPVINIIHTGIELASSEEEVDGYEQP